MMSEIGVIVVIVLTQPSHSAVDSRLLKKADYLFCSQVSKIDSFYSGNIEYVEDFSCEGAQADYVHNRLSIRTLRSLGGSGSAIGRLLFRAIKLSEIRREIDLFCRALSAFKLTFNDSGAVVTTYIYSHYLSFSDVNDLFPGQVVMKNLIVSRFKNLFKFFNFKYMKYLIVKYMKYPIVGSLNKLYKFIKFKE